MIRRHPIDFKPKKSKEDIATRGQTPVVPVALRFGKVAGRGLLVDRQKLCFARYYKMLFYTIVQRLSI